MNLPARFDRALAPLIDGKDNKFALAVSGGGDSMALLHLAARSELIKTSQLHVFTVDHGLRPESAGEADLVKEQANTLGLAHTTLTWDRPSSSQSHARDKRHRLLAGAAKSEGATILLTGHTRSDNVESFLMRARAGSGWYGLAGMGSLTASPVWPEGEGVLVARPMLGVCRADIRSWLEGAGAQWCEDPSNENDKYERVRVRNMLRDAPGLEGKITRIQDRLSALRAARDRKLAECLSAASCSGDRLELPVFETARVEILAQLLSICAMIVAGTDRPARTARCMSAAQRLMSGCEGQSSVTLTLGGAVIRKSKQTLEFRRESNRPGQLQPAEISSRLRHICAGLVGARPA